MLTNMAMCASMVTAPLRHSLLLYMLGRPGLRFLLDIEPDK